MTTNLSPIEREWELIRERELKNISDIHLLLQRVIDDTKQDGTYSDEEVKLAKDKLRKDYETERLAAIARTVSPAQSKAASPDKFITIVNNKAHSNNNVHVIPADSHSASAPVVKTSSIGILQLPDLSSTLMTTIFNLITGFVFAVHAIFMQWTILFLVGQMVMIEFNDLLREDIEKLLDGEIPDMSSPGFIAIILWLLETLVALTLTLVVPESKYDKSWVSWSFKVGSWAVAPFFVVDGIAVIAVIVFFTSNMDIQREWLTRFTYSLTSIGGYIGAQRALGVMSANMPAITSFHKRITTKLATMSSRVITTMGGPWRDTLPESPTPLPATVSTEGAATSAEDTTTEAGEEVEEY